MLNDATLRGFSDGALVLLGIAARRAGAVFASALRLNNSDATQRNYVTFGNQTALNLSNFTIETWFKRVGTGVETTTGGGTDPQPALLHVVPLVSKGAAEADNSTVDANYVLGIDNLSNVLVADFEEAASPSTPGNVPGKNHPIYGVTPIQNGVWYHAAVTYDFTAAANTGTLRLYLNGVLENELAVNEPVRPDNSQPAALGTTIRSNTTTLQGFFDGELDEVRIWNSALAAATIRANLNATAHLTARLAARRAGRALGVRRDLRQLGRQHLRCDVDVGHDHDHRRLHHAALHGLLLERRTRPSTSSPARTPTTTRSASTARTTSSPSATRAEARPRRTSRSRSGSTARARAR